MSGPRRPLVVVTRPAAEAERTRAALAARGYDVLVAPLLAVEHLPDASARLGDLGDVAAVLFTSVNGVRAFAAACARRDPVAYAVGPTTADAARAAGFAHVETADGDVESLARLVAARRRPDQGRLLHASGEAAAGDLAGELSRRGFDVRRVALYRASAAESLPAEFRDTLALGRAQAALFFSPRTARTFVTLARTAGLAPQCRGLVAGCLSPAVAEAAAELDWRIVATAAVPTEAALIDALARVLPADAATADPGTERGSMAEDKNDNNPSEPGVQATIALPAGEVIQRFGGIRPMAGKMGISFSTVQGWKERNHIPPVRHAEIAALAAKHGVTLEPDPAPTAAPAPDAAPGPAAEAAAGPAPQATAPTAAAAGDHDRPPLPPRMPPQDVPAPSSGLGVFGAVVVSVVVVAIAALGAYATRAMWMAGPSGPATATAEPGSVSAELLDRLAKLERAMAARPAAAPAADPKLAQDLAALGRKTADLELSFGRKSAELDTALAGVRSGAQASASAAADQVKALTPRLDALEKGFDPQGFVALRNGLNDLAGKLDGLDKRLTAAERVAAAARAQGLADAALAISVAQLRRTADLGEPFATELAACRAAAGSDAKALGAIDALVPLSGAGVATLASLADEFPEIAAAIARASLKRSETGWLRRVIDRVDTLVTVRPIGAAATGDDPRARAARAETMLARGDLPGAVKLLDALEERPADAAKPWLAKAKARLAADAALTALENQAMAAIARHAAAAKPTP